MDEIYSEQTSEGVKNVSLTNCDCLENLCYYRADICLLYERSWKPLCLMNSYVIQDGLLCIIKIISNISGHVIFCFWFCWGYSSQLKASSCTKSASKIQDLPLAIKLFWKIKFWSASSLNENLHFIFDSLPHSYLRKEYEKLYLNHWRRPKCAFEQPWPFFPAQLLLDPTENALAAMPPHYEQRVGTKLCLWPAAFSWAEHWIKNGDRRNGDGRI